MYRIALGLIAAGLLMTAVPFAAAQNLGGFGRGFGGAWPMSLPSDILRAPVVQPDLEEEAGEQSAPKVHLLLGRGEIAAQPAPRIVRSPFISVQPNSALLVPGMHLPTPHNPRNH